MTDTGKCPAFGYDCEYVAKVEAQAAEIERLREVLENILDLQLSCAKVIARTALGEPK